MSEKPSMDNEVKPEVSRWVMLAEIARLLAMVLVLPMVFMILWWVGTIRLGTFGLLLDANSVLLLTSYPYEPRMRKLEPIRVKFTKVIFGWARFLFIVGIVLMLWQNEGC